MLTWGTCRHLVAAATQAAPAVPSGHRASPQCCCRNGRGDWARAALSSAHTASSHPRIFLTPSHSFLHMICYLRDTVSNQECNCSLLQCPVQLDATGLSWDAVSNLMCLWKSFTFLFQAKQLCIPASGSYVTILEFKQLRKELENNFIKWQPKGWSHTSTSQEKTRKRSLAMLAEELHMPSRTRHRPAQRQARLLPSPPSPWEKTDVKTHLFACRTHHRGYQGGCCGRGNLGTQHVANRAGPVLLSEGA